MDQLRDNANCGPQAALGLGYQVRNHGLRDRFDVLVHLGSSGALVSESSRFATVLPQCCVASAGCRPLRGTLRLASPSRFPVSLPWALHLGITAKTSPTSAGMLCEASQEFFVGADRGRFLRERCFYGDSWCQGQFLVKPVLFHQPEFS